MKSRDQVQIARFASTFLPKLMVDKFVKLHAKLTSENPRAYILVDFNFSVENPMLLRTNITGSGYEKCFLL